MISVNIKSCNLDFFYLLASEKIFKKSWGEADFYNLVNTIANDKLRISAENTNNELFLTTEFEKEIKNRIIETRKLKNEGKNIHPALQKNIIFDNVEAHISMDKLKIIDRSEDLLHTSQLKAIDRLVKFLNMESYYTGQHSKDTKNRFLIRPPELIVSDGSLIPTIILTLFKSGHILFHFSFEMNDIDAKKISSEKWNIPIDECLFPETINENTEDINNISSFQEVMNVYINYYKKTFKVDGLIYNLQHLCLPEFAYQPEYYTRKNSKNFNENIFRVLFAPIFKHQLQAEEQCAEILNNHIYNFSQNFVLYANYNRLISCFSKKFVGDISEQLIFNGFDKESLSEFEFNNEEIYRISIETILNAIENTLIKKANLSGNNFIDFEIGMPLNQLIDKEITETNFYLNEYYKNFYRYESIVKLTKFIENKCENYLRFEDTLIRKNKIESIIHLRKEKLIYNATLLGPFFTIILTILLSYSALESITKGFNINQYLLHIYLSLNIVFDFTLIVIFRTQFKELWYLIKRQIYSFSTHLFKIPLLKPLIKKTSIRLSYYIF